jgi:aminoglycoside phosphotransferase (APT) family kinase protein
MTRILARIRAVDCSRVKEQLYDANSEVTWFVRGNQIPDYMRSHPDGIRIWRAVHDYFPALQPDTPCLVHIDYWQGNVLWEQGKISAVVDWEEAACGDPAVDAVKCFMELTIMGMLEEAEEFLREYELNRGSIANLVFWELAATARSMYDMDSWITSVDKADRLRQFIANYLARLQSAG